MTITFFLFKKTMQNIKNLYPDMENGNQQTHLLLVKPETKKNKEGFPYREATVTLFYLIRFIQTLICG